MHVIKNAFIRIFGVDYPNTTIYADNTIGSYNPDRHKLVITDSVRYNYFDNMEHLCSDFVPKPGDEIHVVPDCPITTQDLRNNYILKRKFDDGVCNVFSNLKNWSIRRCYPFFLFDEERRILAVAFVGANKSIVEMTNRCLEVVPYEVRQSASFRQYSGSSLTIEMYSANDSYLKLLMKTCKKPCVYYKNLNMNRNELTIDVLSMLYSAGIKPMGTDSLKNLNLVLSTVSQYDWHKYPFTIKLVKDMMSDYTSVFHKCVIKPANLGKAAREFLSCSDDIDYKNDKDISLARDFVGQVLGINGTMFVDTNVLIDKLCNHHISRYDFSKLFNTVTRISDRKESAK